MKTFYTIAAIILFVHPAFAIEHSFDEIWGVIVANSYSSKSAESDINAANIAVERGESLWKPQFYLQGQLYNTNDAGQVFMGNISQRAIKGSDFNPSDLNHPGSKSLLRSTLGVELPLYEGGQREATLEASRYYKNSTLLQKNQRINNLYATVLQNYGSIIVLNNERNKIVELRSVAQNTLKNYQLGGGINPVGNSGYLGLKSLINRLDAMLLENESKIRSAKIVIKELGITHIDWEPPKKLTLDNLLLSKAAVDFDQPSFQIKSTQEQVKGDTANAKGARAAYLPYVSAFAQGDLVNGERDVAGSYTAGIYFRWDIYNPSNHGVEQEAKFRALSATYNLMEMKQMESATRLNLKSNIENSGKILTLMRSSNKLLLDQTKETYALYQSGSITVLQWVEVLSRRADLIKDIRELELGLLQMSAYAVTQSNFEVQR